MISCLTNGMSSFLMRLVLPDARPRIFSTSRLKAFEGLSEFALLMRSFPAQREGPWWYGCKKLVFAAPLLNKMKRTKQLKTLAKSSEGIPSELKQFRHLKLAYPQLIEEVLAFVPFLAWCSPIRPDVTWDFICISLASKQLTRFSVSLDGTTWILTMWMTHEEPGLVHCEKRLGLAARSRTSAVKALSSGVPTNSWYGSKRLVFFAAHPKRRTEPTNNIQQPN